MFLSKSKSCVLLALFAMAFAVGCGGGDEPSPGDEPVEGASGGPDGVPVPKSPEGQPAGSQEDRPPRVQFETSIGNFVVELRHDKTPETVENFLKYVDAKFYDGTVFHQVIAEYAIVGGGYRLDVDKRLVLKDQLFIAVTNEAETGLSNLRGTIAMAREPERADSARSQFFINLVDNTSLDHKPDSGDLKAYESIGYCAFGKVVEDGMSVINRIGEVQVTSRDEMSEVPVEPIVIRSVRRIP